MKKTKKISVRNYLGKRLDKRETELKEHLSSVRRARKALAKNRVRFETSIWNAWTNEGGKSVDNVSGHSVRESLDNAEREFLEINHRTDVQGSYTVEAVISYAPEDSERICLPEKTWAKYKGVGVRKFKQNRAKTS